MPFAYVGGYTDPDRNGRGEGIYVYRMDPEGGAWEQIQVLGGVVNPSFMALSDDGRFLYAVNGGDAGGASACAVDPASGKLTLLNSTSVGANNPAYITIGPGGRHVVTANYSGGSVSVVPIRDDGSLDEVSDVRKHEGQAGPNKARQDGPHPHQAFLDPQGRYVLVNDLGLDRTFVYTLENGKLVPNDPPSAAARPGAGPRHLDFAPDGRHVYVINELDSTIQLYVYDPARGQLAPVHHVSTLPADFDGKNTTAQVKAHPNGRFVYGSNRGHDSIAIFAVNQTTKRLTPIGWESTQGKTPRNFNLDPPGRFLYAANQDSDTVVTFRVDDQSGMLAPTGQVIQAGSPSCVIFGGF